MCADYIVSIPSAGSLNLSHAVLSIGYELYVHHYPPHLNVYPNCNSNFSSYYTLAAFILTPTQPIFTFDPNVD